MRKVSIFILSILLLISISCKTASVSKPNSSISQNCEIPKKEHTIQALLWQQRAAEYKALTHQAYNLAKIQLDQILKNNHTKPIAIVTDIDETVLNNSPYNARMVKTDSNYTKKSWIAWGKEANAKAIPGAVAFFKYAKSKGVAIFYISNRYDVQKPETIKNLKTEGFPGVDDTHVLLKTSTSQKQPRRDLVKKDYEIVLLLGDNLSDFSELFDKQSTKTRNALVDELQANFGTKFIVFPNPMYGDWETKGIYEGSYKWSAKQQDSIRKAKLIYD